MATEKLIRDALRRRVVAETSGACDAVDEFWLPRSNERVDIAVVGRWLDAFEIKTERDNLRRLPRQALAYARVFDRCTVVVAEKHKENAEAILPEWWGIMTISLYDGIGFKTARKPRPNPKIDPDILVRLLWRDEAMSALRKFGDVPDARASRDALWEGLLHAATLVQLQKIVRHAIINRDPARARIATRRFTSRLTPVGAGL